MELHLSCTNPSISWWRHQMETFSASLVLCDRSRWIPRTKASDAELWCFLWSASELNGWVNNREAGDLRRHRGHYDVNVMKIHLYGSKWPCPEFKSHPSYCQRFFTWASQQCLVKFVVIILLFRLRQTNIPITFKFQVHNLSLKWVKNNWGIILPKLICNTYFKKQLLELIYISYFMAIDTSIFSKTSKTDSCSILIMLHV